MKFDTNLANTLWEKMKKKVVPPFNRRGILSETLRDAGITDLNQRTQYWMFLNRKIGDELRSKNHSS